MVKDQCSQLLSVCPIVSCLSLTVLSVEIQKLIIVCYLNIINRNNTKSADVTSWVWGMRTCKDVQLEEEGKENYFGIL